MRGLGLEPEDEAASDFQEARNYHHAQQISTSLHNVVWRRYNTVQVGGAQEIVELVHHQHCQAVFVRMSDTLLV